MSIPKIKTLVSKIKNSTWILKLNMNNTKIHLGKSPSTLYIDYKITNGLIIYVHFNYVVNVIRLCHEWRKCKYSKKNF